MSTRATRVAPIQLRVASPPDPGQLRPAIAAQLSGRPWPPGPEADVAQAVADAVAGAQGRVELGSPEAWGVR